MITSQKINVIRYTNGTLVKITPSAEAFLSLDYDPQHPDAATYLPDKIYLEAEPEGDLRIAGWQYSTDGQAWTDITASTEGMSITGNVLTLLSTCRLFQDGYLVIRAYANDPTYYDTVTIRKEVNATVVYDKASTAIDQTNRKIALIASEEQLIQYTEEQTMASRMASIEVKADNITARVTADYATKAYTDSAAQNAENASNTATDTKLGNYPTKTETTSEINQKASEITSAVSSTYQTKTAAASDLTEAKGYTDTKLQSYPTTTEMNSAITQKASEITSSVSSTYQTKAQAQTDLNTAKDYTDTSLEDYQTLDQAATDLQTAKDYAEDEAGAAETAANTATDNKLRNYSTTTQMRSEIQQTASSITSSVSATYQTKAQAESDLTEAKGYTDTSLQDYTTKTEHSQLVQTVNGISTEVGTKVGNDEIISRINQSAEAVTILANKINLNGAVTANQYFKINTDGSFDGVKGSIGNIHIVGNAMYSGDHDTIYKNVEGFYISSDGDVIFGNFYGDQYLLYKRQWSASEGKYIYELRVKATSLMIGGSAVPTTTQMTTAVTAAKTEAKNYAEELTDGVSDDVEEVREIANNSAKTATNFLYYDSSNGLVVSETGTATGSSAFPFNTQFKADGINFRTQNKVLASLTGSALQFNRGTTEKPAMILTGDALDFYNKDGTTVAASIGTSGLDIITGTLGAFRVATKKKQATTANGGHLYDNSLYTHTEDSSYEYELGLRGAGTSTLTGAGFYVARIDKGGTWSTSNATLLMNFTTKGEGKIGGWTISQTRLYSGKLYLDAAAQQLGFGNYQKQTGMYRSTAEITDAGYASLKRAVVDQFAVGDNYIGSEPLTSSNWNTVEADKSGIRIYKASPVTAWKTLVLSKADELTVGTVAPSSKRYKDIDRHMTAEDVRDAYDLVPVIAKYKDGYLADGDPSVGKYMPMFVAEEVEKAIPEAVVYDKDGLVEDWNYRVVIPVQHQMILDQKKRIDDLESEVAELKEQLAEIMSLLKGAKE